jgi:hypothetical protein
MASRPATVSLPKDAELVGLWPEKITLQTRQCLLPGTRLAFDLVLEGNALPLTVTTGVCLVVNRDREGFIYQLQISLDQIPSLDRNLIALFISKGKGTPRLARMSRESKR